MVYSCLLFVDAQRVLRPAKRTKDTRFSPRWMFEFIYWNSWLVAQIITIRILYSTHSNQTANKVETILLSQIEDLITYSNNFVSEKPFIKLWLRNTSMRNIMEMVFSQPYVRCSYTVYSTCMSHTAVFVLRCNNFFLFCYVCQQMQRSIVNSPISSWLHCIDIWRKTQFVRNIFTLELNQSKCYTKIFICELIFASVKFTHELRWITFR